MLSRCAATYTKSKGKVPVLFIDGVDILAKRHPELCCAFITATKILANGNTIKLVLVSTEGGIMPFLKELSAINRALVGDVK